MTGHGGRVHRAGAAPHPLGRRDRHQLVAEERRHRQLAIAHRQADDPDIQIVGHDGPRDLGRIAGHDDDLDLGMAPAKAAQRQRQQVDADRGAGAQPHASGHHAAQLLDALHAGLQLAQRAVGVGEQQRAGVGGKRALAHALEQRQPQRLLEKTDLHADRRLGEVERARRARERVVTRDRLQRAQMRDRDVHRQNLRDGQDQNN